MTRRRPVMRRYFDTSGPRIRPVVRDVRISPVFEEEISGFAIAVADRIRFGRDIDTLQRAAVDDGVFIDGEHPDPRVR